MKTLGCFPLHSEVNDWASAAAAGTIADALGNANVVGAAGATLWDPAPLARIRTASAAHTSAAPNAAHCPHTTLGPIKHKHSWTNTHLPGVNLKLSLQNRIESNQSAPDSN